MQTNVAYRANRPCTRCNDRGEGGTVIDMTNNYRNCRECHRHTSIVGRLSHKGLCGQCSVKAMLDSNSSIHRRRGPKYTKWIRAQFIAFAELVYRDGVTTEEGGHPLVIAAGDVVQWLAQGTVAGHNSRPNDQGVTPE